MREITYREALREALREEMLRDQSVFIAGEDVGPYGGAYAVTRGLYEEFGEERVKDTPISEAAIVGLGTGAALIGLRPVIEIMYIDFTTLAMDQIVNQAAKFHYMSGGNVSVPWVLRTQGGAGRSGAAQHSQSLEGWFVHIPGLKVIAPSTPYDAKGLLKSAIRDNNPVIFIEHKLIYNNRGQVPGEEYIVPIGKGIVRKEGKDVTIVSYSKMMDEVLKASQVLTKENIDVEIIDLRTLKPMDYDLIFESVKKTSHLLIVEEDHHTLGVGAEISAKVSETIIEYLDAPILRIAALDVPIPAARKLEKVVIPNKDRIVKGVEEILK